MAKKEPTIRDVHELLGDFFKFVKTQFERNERRNDLIVRRFELVNADIRDIKQGQREIEKDLQGIKEDLSGITGAIAELVETQDDFEQQLEKIGGK